MKMTISRNVGQVKGTNKEWWSIQWEAIMTWPEGQGKGMRLPEPAERQSRGRGTTQQQPQPEAEENNHYQITAWQRQSESEVAQSCPTLCDPVDCSPPGSCVHGILQARILEWVAIFFSRGSSQPKDRTHFCVGRQILYCWATREALKIWELLLLFFWVRTYWEALS